MFYNVFSMFSFNEIDYLTYMNLWMLFLYYWIMTFFVVIVSSLLIRSSMLFVNDGWLEFILTLFSLWLVLLIISPLFIMFIDYDSILLSSLLVYSLGYQWSWSFNLNGALLATEAQLQLSSNASPSSMSAEPRLSLMNVSFDHFLVPSINYISFAASFWDDTMANNYASLFNSTSFSSTSLTSYLVYFMSLNTILLLPCYLGFSFLIFSFDVMHSLGFYSLGFKMDAMPGRMNYSFELSTLFKGEHSGFCYELCGTSHSSMLILAMSL